MSVSGTPVIRSWYSNHFFPSFALYNRLPPEKLPIFINTRLSACILDRSLGRAFFRRDWMELFNFVFDGSPEVASRVGWSAGPLEN